MIIAARYEPTRGDSICFVVKLFWPKFVKVLKNHSFNDVSVNSSNSIDRMGSNDGKMSQSVIGAVCLGMAMPSLIMGGVMRLFRPDLQKYFAIMAGVCLAGGAALLALA